jgi:hypothetical protein
MRHPLRVVTAGALACVLASVVMVTLLRGPVGVALDARTHFQSVSVVQQEISQFAVNQASEDGDPTPANVRWVSTTLEAASNLLEGPAVSGTPAASRPVYVIEVQGQFSEGDEPAQESGKHVAKPEDYTGTYIWFVVDQSPWLSEGGGLQDDPIPLDTLGSVEVASLNGISPTTMLQWRAKFGIVSHITSRSADA